ncbi:GIY-YIG nuclease family protein [Vibrio breoganii]|uniref:GIY-YIG nuclease family protein n=1 Tax=Vibrio breoganii TaxID=553239 RepID=UPI00035F2AAF|nr:GIY-YIG nuclease family protein [Vibrio breoganii]OED96346.1 endonuclease [Vibrio breoganii ZF-29]PML12035.1 endonuclease [Vibrio breoganii]PML40644.1 endonuclease [Vibrio breoganii]PML84649.1 endonuclease [Vibrio breoganii]PMM83122.1 endonuclease [Vibrio breoganii]
MTKHPCVYILSSPNKNVLYIGVTSNLPARVWQHKSKVVEGFTYKYNVSKLVYYEAHDSMESAITREKQLKTWNRAWKENLVVKMNPEWKDLYEELF